MPNKVKLRPNELPSNCQRCDYWRESEEWGYKICVLANISGSPKKLPAECPLRGRTDVAYA